MYFCIASSFRFFENHVKREPLPTEGPRFENPPPAAGIDFLSPTSCFLLCFYLSPPIIKISLCISPPFCTESLVGLTPFQKICMKKAPIVSNRCWIHLTNITGARVECLSHSFLFYPCGVKILSRAIEQIEHIRLWLSDVVFRGVRVQLAEVVFDLLSNPLCIPI